MSELSAIWRSTAVMIRTEALASRPSTQRDKMLAYARDCERCAEELERKVTYKVTYVDGPSAMSAI